MTVTSQKPILLWTIISFPKATWSIDQTKSSIATESRINDHKDCWEFQTKTRSTNTVWDKTQHCSFVDNNTTFSTHDCIAVRCWRGMFKKVQKIYTKIQQWCPIPISTIKVYIWGQATQQETRCIINYNIFREGDSPEFNDIVKERLRYNFMYLIRRSLSVKKSTNSICHCCERDVNKRAVLVIQLQREPSINFTE